MKDPRSREEKSQTGPKVSELLTLERSPCLGKFKLLQISTVCKTCAEALQRADLLPQFPAFPSEGRSGKHCKNSLLQSILAPLFPTGMQKVQRLENLKRHRGRQANSRFQTLASLTWGWFKLEVKVWARCSFYMSQGIQSGRKLRIKRQLSGAETFTRASPECSAWPGQPAAGS